jgi:hypothetical protein
MKIYIGRNGEQQGPYSIEELNNLAKLEPITGNDMCWYNGCAAWIPLSQLAGFIPSPSPPPTAVPSAFQQKQPSTASLPTAESGMGTNANETLYYLVLDSEQAGPFTSGQLRAMWQNGKVNAQTKYCAVGGTSWRPLIDLRTMLEPAPVQPTTVSPPFPLSHPAVVRQPIAGSELLGVIMLVTPIVSTLLIWQWVGSMNLLQNPSSTLQMLVILTIVGTAALGAIEANQLGIGNDLDVTKNGKKRSGPAQWFVFMLVMWILGFPMYLYWRSRYGRKNYLIGGIFAALLFSGVAYAMSSVIEDTKSKIRHQFEQFR